MRLFVPFLFTVISFCNYAQSLETTFPQQACLQQNLLFKNDLSVTPAEAVWDFCEGDLHATGLTVTSLPSQIGMPIGVELIESNGKWYGFVTDRVNNKLFRLDFGNMLTNTNPAVIDLGNLGGKLDQPQSIEVVAYQNSFFAFVNNLGNNGLVRINFGADIETTSASADVVLASPGLANGGIDVAFDGVAWVVAFTRADRLKLISLGSSPANVVVNEMDTSPIFGALNIGDVRFVHDNGIWYAFISAYSSGNFFRLEFGTSLFSDPVSSELSEAVPYLPFGIEVAKDNGEWILFSSTLSGNLVRLKLGPDIENNTPVYSDLGTFDKLINTLKISLARAGSRWVALTASYDNKNLHLVQFAESDCGFNKSFSDNKDTVAVRPLKAGNFYASLTVRDPNGLYLSKSEKITVTNLVAPLLQVTNTLCSTVTTEFAITSPSSIDNVVWDFDNDLIADATGATASFNFNISGDFKVWVQARGANGCLNTRREAFTLYPPASPDFIIPAGLICTNNNFVYSNQTPGNFDGNLTYQWYVNNTLVSEQKDLQHKFVTEGDQTIKLITTIPGCSTEKTQLVSDVKAGPVVDFSRIGRCEDILVSFVNESQGTINSFLWNFGDGADQSTELNAKHTFTTPGTYYVSLTANGTNGCITTHEEEVIINSKPIADFSITNENVCNNTSLQFQDDTTVPDTPLSKWAWNFGDSQVSNASNPSHRFNLPGSYNVTLNVTAESGCSDVIQKAITVKTSPDSSFTYSPACRNLPSQFNGPSQAGIVSWQWLISDKSYSTRQPQHTFRTPGDYQAKLIVESSNGCQGVATKTVTVPIPLVVDPLIEKNCVGTETIFTDNTQDTDDPVTKAVWKFDNGLTKKDEQLSILYNETGEHQVELTVTGESGCSYSAVETFQIVPHPQASFTVSSTIGSPPFPVVFTNGSVNASIFNWNFGDNASSNAESPTHTFTEVGSYNVELIASNPQGCESKAEKIITLSPPHPDVNIIAINSIENSDNTLKITITLQNDGNTILNSLPVDIDISGNSRLREIIDGPIYPQARYNLTLSYGIMINRNVEFLCASTELTDDQQPQMNRECIEFTNEINFLNGYPNPAKDYLTIDWLAPDGKEQVKIALVNSLGSKVVLVNFESEKGLNQKIFDISGLQNGIYMLVFEGANKTTVQRIVVNH
jgi:PKD repeat protein